jgi:hypothetical protein
LELTEDEKGTWRDWAEWDKKRYARELAVFQSRRSDAAEMPEDSQDYEEDAVQDLHVPKKRRMSESDETIPKRKKKS